MQQSQFPEKIFLVTAALAVIVALAAPYGVGAGTVLSVVAALSCPLVTFLFLRRVMADAEQQAARTPED